MYDGDPIMQTPFNQELRTLDRTAITLQRWEYNPKKNLMEIEFKAKNVSSNPFPAKLSFVAKEKQNPAKNLPLKIVFHSNDVYVIQIKKVPEKYKVVGLFIKEKDDQMDTNTIDDSETTESTTQSNNTISKLNLYGDYREIKVNKSLTIKNKKQYITDGIENEIRLQKIEIDNLEKGISLQDGIIEELQKQIKELEVNKKYQTKNEITDTNAEITTKKNGIQSAKDTQNDMRKKLKDTQEKIKKLEQKLKDAAQKFQQENQKK